MANPSNTAQADPNQPQTQAKQKKGSGFTNIGKVTAANNPAQLAGAVSSGVSNVAGKTVQQAGQAQDAFNKQSQAGRVDTEANASAIKDAIQDPTTAVANQQTSDLFNRTLQGANSYKGPNELQGAQSLTSAAQNAQNLGNATRSNDGRLALLQRFGSAAGKQYTSGQQNLDNILLGQSGANFSGARDAARQANQTATNAIDQSRGQAELARSDAEKFKQQALDQLTSGQKAITDPAQAQYETAKAAEDKRQADSDRVYGLITGGSQLQQQELDDVRKQISADPTKYFGQDFTSFYSPEAMPYLVNNLSNADLTSHYLSQNNMASLGDTSKSGLSSLGYLTGLAKQSNTPLTSVIGNNSSAAQNLNVGGFLSNDNVAKLEALSRLGGTTNMVQKQGDYKAGDTSFNSDTARKTLEDKVWAAPETQQMAKSYYGVGGMGSDPNSPEFKSAILDMIARGYTR